MNQLHIATQHRQRPKVCDHCWSHTALKIWPSKSRQRPRVV